MSEKSQLLHEVATEAEVAEVRAEIAEQAVEILEERVEIAEEHTAEVLLASVETEHGRRIAALEERFEEWRLRQESSPDLTAQLTAQLAALRAELLELLKSEKTETSSTPPVLTQTMVEPATAKPEKEKSERKEAPTKPSRKKGIWF